MTAPLGLTWLFEVDWDSNGSYTDITDYIEGEGNQVVVDWRENSATEVTVTLHNRDGAFTPRYLSATYFPYAGQEGIPCRLKRTYSAATVTMFVGYIMDWDWIWPEGVNTQSLVIRCGDRLALIGEQEVDVDPTDGSGTDDAFAAVMLGAGLSASDYDVTAGATGGIAFVPQANEDADDPAAQRPTVASLVSEILAAEMTGAAYCDRTTGKPTFKNRSSFLGVSSPTSWGDGTNIEPQIVSHSQPRGQLFTKCRTSLSKVTFGGANQEETVVYDAGYENVAGRTLVLAAGAVVGPFRIVPNQPGVAGIFGEPKCVSGVDYKASSTDGGGTDETTDVNVVLTPVAGLNYVYDMTIRNTDISNVKYLWKLQVRSVPITNGSGDVLNSVAGTAPTVADDAGVGTISWTNPTNAETSNGSHASVALTLGQTSHYLKFTSWGFNIPLQAQIVGVAVQAEILSSAGSATDLSARIVIAGTIESDETKTCPVTTVEDFVDLSNGFDNWSQTLTPAIINASDFGFAIWIASSANSQTYQVDSLRVVVSYLNHIGARQETVTYVRELVIPNNNTRRTLPLNVPYVQSDNLVRDFAEQELRKGQWPNGEIVTQFLWENADTINEMAALDYGDLKQLTLTADGASGPYINDWYRVVDFQHNITIGAVPFSVVRLRPSDRWRNLDAIIWDDFNRDNGDLDGDTTPTGDTWTVVSGSWAIATNKARAGADDSLMIFDLGVSDFVFEMSASNMSSDTDELVEMVFRYVDADNYLLFRLNDSLDKAELRKIVANVETEIATAVNWTPTATAQRRVMCQGNRIRVWLDRKLIFDIASETTHNTATILGLFQSKTTTVDEDDMYAQGLKA